MNKHKDTSIPLVALGGQVVKSLTTFCLMPPNVFNSRKVKDLVLNLRRSVLKQTRKQLTKVRSSYKEYEQERIYKFLLLLCAHFLVCGQSNSFNVF
jgi:hypothetical protein